ncbi:uncharacterized protein DS421_15g515170 [Arachis hypogaea]|nr:uncharacterized protein DS421_15g515170 [Arachis hypogaea]
MAAAEEGGGGATSEVDVHGFPSFSASLFSLTLSLTKMAKCPNLSHSQSQPTPLFSVLPVVGHLFLVIKNASVFETSLSLCVEHHSVRSANVPIPPWTFRRRYRMKSLRCVRCLVVWSLRLICINVVVTVVNFKWIECHVTMSVFVVQISDWIDRCMFTMSTGTRSERFIELDLDHSAILLHGLHTTKGRPKITRFLNEMDMRMIHGPRRCRQCGAEGHSCSRCRQCGGTSIGGVPQNT